MHNKTYKKYIANESVCIIKLIKKIHKVTVFFYLNLNW